MSDSGTRIKDFDPILPDNMISWFNSLFLAPSLENQVCLLQFHVADEGCISWSFSPTPAFNLYSELQEASKPMEYEEWYRKLPRSTTNVFV